MNDLLANPMRVAREKGSIYSITEMSNDKGINVSFRSIYPTPF